MQMKLTAGTLECDNTSGNPEIGFLDLVTWNHTENWCRSQQVESEGYGL